MCLIIISCYYKTAAIYHNSMGHKWLAYTPVIYAMCSYDVIAHGGIWSYMGKYISIT